MSDASLVFLAKLLATIANAHSPRTLVKELASAFDEHAAITAIAIEGAVIARIDRTWKIADPLDRTTTPVARNRERVTRDDATGTGADASMRKPDASMRKPVTRDDAMRELVPGLDVTLRDELPAYFANPTFLDVLAQVVTSARRHVSTIERLAATSRTSHAKRRELADTLARAEHGLVARSTVMQDILARVQLVARHPTTVLLTGESGTGKELVARELHRLSPRSRRPFVQLNCGALAAELVESELFGHERGAFTGADRTHVGIFERANGGTLLLDEIGDLPLAAQAKLLRVLQEQNVRRVGGSADIALDVRVVAATHRDLRSAAFREDLYYRLAVFQIEMPPLRARRDDLAPLAAALINELAAKLGMAAPALSRADFARLAAYDWPGNVRELRNVLETMLIVGELPALATRTARRTNPSLDTTLREAIESALRASRGKIYGDGGAAARLGVPPATLQSKMKKLGIPRERFA